MTSETLQAIAGAVVVLSQLYLLAPWEFRIFAYFWDWLARWAGNLANILGWVSMQSRLNYFAVVQEVQ